MVRRPFDALEVRNVKLQWYQPATYGDVLSISTEVAGWRHVWARRRSEVRRDGSQGELLALVDTDWVLLGDAGRPARVPEDIARYFSPGKTFSRSRVRLPDPRAHPTTLSTRVRRLDVDPLGHMNNAAYLDIVDDGIARMPDASGAAPDCYRVGYIRPALPDSVVDLACWPADGGSAACRISDGDGKELTRALVSWTES